MKRFILFLIILTASLYGQQWQITSVEPSYISKFFIANDGVVFAGGAPGEFYKYSGQDSTWRKLNNIDLQYKTIYENRAGELIALPTNYEGGEVVKISTDFGNTWNSGESVLSGRCASYGDTLVSSIYISADGGHTWKRAVDKLSQDLGGRFIPTKNKLFYMEPDSAQQYYNYYIYSLEDGSLKPIGNYAYKRAAYYNTEYVNNNLSDSVKLPFATDSYSGIKLHHTLDFNGNLILHNGSKAMFRYINGKWEILNYVKSFGWPIPDDCLGVTVEMNYAFQDSAIYKINYDSTFALIPLLVNKLIGVKSIDYSSSVYNNNSLFIQGKETVGTLLLPIFQKYDIAQNKLIELRKGIPGQSIIDLQSASGIKYAQHIQGKIFKSADGVKWNYLPTPSNGKSLFTDSLIIAGSDADGGPSYISTDGGATWNRFISAITPKGISVFDIYSNGQDIIFSNYRVFSDREIVISRDKGKTWEILLRPSQFANKVYTVNNEFLASTYDPYVYIASDSAHIDTTTPPAYVNSFARAGSAYFGGTEQGIIKLERTQPSGNRLFKTAAEWTFTGLEGKKILSLTSDSIGVVYAGTEDGTYFSADSGATWEVYGTVVSGSLKKTAISGLSQVKALLVNGSELFAAASEGLYKTKTYGAIGINEEPNITVTGYELKQNYPNPFNPATNISFTLPKAARVKLTVYNMLGQEVGQLVNMELGQGSYNYKFDGHQLSSGVYIYSLEAGTFRTAKKMMLIK